MGSEQHVAGRVSGVQNRTEVYGGGMNNSASSVNILVFRLTPEDGRPPMHVEMRGGRINGSVVEGEVVDAYGSTKRNGVFRAKRIVSRDTGLVVDTKIPGVLKVVVGVFFVIVLGFIVFVAVQVFSGVGEVTDRVKQQGPSSQPSSRPTMGRPSGFSDPSEFRQRAREDCYADPNFSREQCDFLYG